ncbi:MAG: SUMF1/EgtB/PvdO family nonheme iron enzyme [Anaerolineales bacterium]|nr:MAG: SUMF1/EgtB/PvdO family nonheme iron enzyme [Anaerolineales bacterium]
MSISSYLEKLSKITEAILHSPFEWCHVNGGSVVLQDATKDGGTKGGTFQVQDFAIAKYPITNLQYERFIKNSNGFANTHWWKFSSEAVQWRKDHKNPKPPAFNDSDLPRTRVSWFDSMAFCSWLSAELKNTLHDDKPMNIHNVFTWITRLPTEQEWQRAAIGDTGWCYPWGNTLDETRGNYGNNVGQPSNVDKYSAGKSIFGVMDMTGNLWERCLTGWNQEIIDIGGYTYRIIKGGAWNIGNPDYLRSKDRGCHPPRGQLNDCGFRVLLDLGLQSQKAT